MKYFVQIAVELNKADNKKQTIPKKAIKRSKSPDKTDGLVKKDAEPEEPVEKKPTKAKASKPAKPIIVEKDPLAEDTNDATRNESPEKKVETKKALKKAPLISSAGTTSVNVVMSIEHCKSCHRFGLKANEMFKEISELIPTDSNISLELAINEQTPRRGAFEVSLYRKEAVEDKKEIWTGLKKGPPRKNKYPETSKVVEDILEYAKQLK